MRASPCPHSAKLWEPGQETQSPGAGDNEPPVSAFWELGVTVANHTRLAEPSWWDHHSLAPVGVDMVWPLGDDW